MAGAKKKELVVAKKLVVNDFWLVVNDFWLVVNGDLAIKVRLNSKLHTEKNKVKNYIHVLCMFTGI